MGVLNCTECHYAKFFLSNNAALKAMKYSCCRSVTSNVLINFQLVTLIESNVYCLATIQAGRVRVETDGNTKRRACVQQPCFYLCNKQRPKGQLKSSQVYPFRACIRMCISNFWWNTLPCSNTDTKCIVSSRQYHEEEAEGHYVAKIQFLSGKGWSKAFLELDVQYL